MDKKQLEQEHICLEAKYLCDLLRTKLFLIDNFQPSYSFYSKRLIKLKSELDHIYWGL